MTVSGSPPALAVERRAVRVRAELGARAALAIASVAGVVFVASAWVASSGDVPEWEADVLRYLNGWPDWLEPIAWVVQQGGVLAGPVAAGLVLAWWGRRWAYAVPFVALVPLKLGLEWLVLKQVVERGRPWETVGGDIEVRGPALEGLGFPSGHSTTAMACAVLLVAFLPARWRAAPVVWAVMVGVARLYYGEHNPLDVVAGLALGSIYGVALRVAFLDRLAPGRGEVPV